MTDQQPELVTVIAPNPKMGLNLGEIWKKRELLFFFMWRTFKVRYKQTVIGAGWAIFRPLMLMVVFTVFFHRTVGISSGNGAIPYPIFSYVGLLFWTYFSQTVVAAGDSLIANQSIVKKVYLPRLIIPLSVILTGLVDFFIASFIYIAMMFYYGIFPGLSGVLLFLPMLLLSVATVLGVGCFAAALNVRYRDIGQALPFIIQTLLFLTPVIYPVSLVPSDLKWLLFINPMTGVIETMRSTLIGGGGVEVGYLSISVVSALIMLWVGVKFFKRQEKVFADLV